jgi:Ca-activated chloride channel family protein
MADALGLMMTAVTLMLQDGIGSQVTPEFRISVNVDLVVLHATVRDRRGRAAADLREQDFAVYEDGVRQAIRLFRYEDLPVTVGLVVDHSGSMGDKLADVVAAAETFVLASSPEDEMFVVNFNEKVTLGLPAATPFTNRAAELTQAISNTPTTGQTALYDAVVEGLERLRAGSKDKKVLIVISDGADNASRHRLDDVLRLAGESSAIVYAVGIADLGDPDRNPGVLKRLARETGGEAYFPRDVRDVVKICEGIAREIRSQYTIGFVSANQAAPGGYRRVRVNAAAPGHRGLQVRARSGYVAAPSGKGPVP